MNKRILSMVLAFVLVLGTVSISVAAPFDLTHKENPEKAYTLFDLFEDFDAFDDVFNDQENYLFEAEDGKLYSVKSINEYLDENPEVDLEDALKEIEPEEIEEKELKVTNVSAINTPEGDELEVVLSDVPEEAPTATSVTVTRTINGEEDASFVWGGGVSSWNEETKTLTISEIAPVEATEEVQEVVYSVAYGDTDAVAANALTVEAIEVEAELTVESVSAINANTISVTFEGIEEPVEIELEEALVHGQTEVTFVYEDVEYTAELTEAWVDETVVEQEIAEAVDAAISAINEIGNPATLNLEDEAKVVAARTAVDDALELGAEETAIVNLDHLNAAETQINALKEALNEKETAIQEANVALTNLPLEVTLEDKEQVEEARELVNKALELGAEETDFVNLWKLKGAEATIAELEEAAAAAELAAAKETAKAELDEYVNAEDYTENAEALATALAEGKEAIDAAETTEEVDAAVVAAKEAIDAIETDAQIAEREAEEALAAAKETKIEEIEAVVLTEEETAGKTEESILLAEAKLQELKDAALAEVEAAETVEAVEAVEVDTAEALALLEDEVVALTVESVSAINDVEVEFGTPVEELELPEEIEVILSNEETDVANVEWNTESYDPELEGEQEIKGTLVVPEGKEWTIPEELLAVTVKVIVGEDTRVEVEKVETTVGNDNTVILTFVEALAEDFDLTDKEIKVNDMVAKYVADSYDAKAKTAKFKLAGEEDKLVDAEEYTVTSDWAKDATFVAKIADPYVAKFVEVTEKVPASRKDKDGKVIPTNIAVAAENQYGEEYAISNAATVEVKGKLNGMPLKDDEISYEDGIVIVTIELKENDILEFTLTNNKDDKVLAEDTFTYEIIKGEAPVVTSIVLKADKTSVPSGKDIKFIADVRDQYNSPFEENLRWVVNGKVQEEITGAEFILSEKEPGEYKVQVFSTTNSKVQDEMTVTIGAAELKELTVEKAPADVMKKSSDYNNEEHIIGMIKPNEGAALLPENIKFHITTTDKELTEDDIKVTAEKVTTGKGEEIIIIKAVTSKPGTYKVTPFVGDEFTAEDTIKATEQTVTTTINPKVSEVSDFAFDAKELKVGAKEVRAEIVLKNKHGEVLTAEQVINNNDIQFTTTKEDVTGKVTLVQGEEDNKDKTYINLAGVVKDNENIGLQKGKAEVSVVLDGITKAKTTVDVKEAELTTIKLEKDKIEGVVAGDEEELAKYNEVKFLDQDGVELVISENNVSLEVLDSEGKKVTGDGSLVKFVTGNFDKDGNFKTDATDKKNFIKVSPGKELEKGTYTVVVSVGEGEDVIEASFTVEVGEARKVSTIELAPETTKLAVGGKTTLNIVTKDQYGDFIEVNSSGDAIDLEAKLPEDNTNVELGNFEKVEDEGEVVAYKVEVTGAKKGTAEVTVSVKDNKDVKPATVTFTVDAAGSLINSVEIDTEGIKDLYYTGGENGASVELKAIAKDVEGKVLAIDDKDLTWRVVEVKKANDEVTGTVDMDGTDKNKVVAGHNFVGTATIEVITANLKRDTITLNFDNKAPEAQVDTVKAYVKVDDKDVEVKDVLKINEVTNVYLKGLDQYGNEDLKDINYSEVTWVTTTDRSVAEAKVVESAIEVTPKAEGTADINILYNGDTFTVRVVVEYTEEQKALFAAKEAFLTSLEQVKTLNENLYTINYSKAENKVEIEFKKEGLEKSEDIISDVEAAAKSFINAMFGNKELKVKEIEVLNLTFTNGEYDSVIALAIELLSTLDNNPVLSLQKFLKGAEVKKSLDIKVTLEDDSEFTVKDVKANFRIDEPFTKDESGIDE